MQTQTNHKNYAAVCACGVVRGSIRADYRHAKEMGKTITNWVRCGYIIKFVTDSYIRDHSGVCTCDDEAVRHG